MASRVRSELYFKAAVKILELLPHLFQWHLVWSTSSST